MQAGGLGAAWARTRCGVGALFCKVAEELREHWEQEPWFWEVGGEFRWTHLAHALREMPWQDTNICAGNMGGCWTQDSSPVQWLDLSGKEQAEFEGGSLRKLGIKSWLIDLEVVDKYKGWVSKRAWCIP